MGKDIFAEGAGIGFGDEGKLQRIKRDFRSGFEGAVGSRHRLALLGHQRQLVNLRFCPVVVGILIAIGKVSRINLVNEPFALSLGTKDFVFLAQHAEGKAPVHARLHNGSDATADLATGKAALVGGCCRGDGFWGEQRAVFHLNCLGDRLPLFINCFEVHL